MKEIPQQQQTQRHLGSLWETTENSETMKNKKQQLGNVTQSRGKSRQLTNITAQVVLGVNEELSGTDWIPRGLKEHAAISYVWQRSVSRSNVSGEIVQR